MASVKLELIKPDAVGAAAAAAGTCHMGTRLLEALGEQACACVQWFMP